MIQTLFAELFLAPTPKPTALATLDCTQNRYRKRTKQVWKYRTDCGYIPGVPRSTVIDKNEDGSDITQDVDVLVWWRDVGQARFPRITVMSRQFLAIPAASATAERVFSFAGLMSDLHKSLLEGTLEAIMWAKWGSPSIPLGRGDLHITHPELCD